MSKLMFTKFCQSRSRILSAMAFLEKKGMKKKLHFAIIDQKLYPIFNTSWNARNLEFCMSQIISRKILTHKFDNFWCASSSKKRVLHSSQAWFKICKILKSCYRTTTGSRIFRFYTSMRDGWEIVPAKAQVFIRSSVAPMAKRPKFWNFRPLDKIQDVI